MSTIYILWLRQVKRYLRSKARIAGSLGQPLLYMLALGFGLGSVFQRAGNGNYLQFIVPGIITMSILFTAIFSGMEIIWDRQFGFLKETLVAPVSRFHIVFGRVLGGATVAALQGVIVLFLALLLNFRPNWSLFLPAVVVMLVIAILFSALGTAIACLIEDMQGFQLIMNFLVMPIFFFSGALFPLEGLPAAMAVVTKIDPLTYGIDSLRGLLIGANHFPLWTSTGLLVAIMVGLLLVSSYLFNRMQI